VVPSGPRILVKGLPGSAEKDITGLLQYGWDIQPVGVETVEEGLVFILRSKDELKKLQPSVRVRSQEVSPPFHSHTPLGIEDNSSSCGISSHSWLHHQYPVTVMEEEESTPEDETIFFSDLPSNLSLQALCSLIEAQEDISLSEENIRLLPSGCAIISMSCHQAKGKLLSLGHLKMAQAKVFMLSMRKR